MPLLLTWIAGGAAQGGSWCIHPAEPAGEVRLLYLRDGIAPDGQPLGRFAATAEAMLAVAMYEAAEPAPAPAGAWRLAAAGGAFVLARDAAGLRLRFESSWRDQPDEVARLHAPPAALRPACAADPAALDAAILRRLAALRCARADVPALQPLQHAELPRG